MVLHTLCTGMPRKSITFGVVENGDIEALLSMEGEPLSFTKTDEEKDRIFGEYSYRSDPQFGTPSESENEFVYDGVLEVVGLVTEHDRPKPETMFRKVEDETGVEITAPEYPASASHDFYRTYGFNGYTTSFRENIRTYDYSSSYTYIKPDERAEEQAMHSRTRMSDDLVGEVVEDLIDQGYYVSSMDMVLEEDGGSISFSNPLRFTGITEEEWSRETLHLVCDIATELVTDNVKTVEEVLAE